MNEELQNTLQPLAGERVNITYDVQSGGVVKKRTLPFIVAVLADLGGERDASAPGPLFGARSMIDIHRDNVDEVMAAIRPRIVLDKLNADDVLLREILTAPGDAALTFPAMAAFNPLSVVQSLPSLNALYAARGQIRALQNKAEVDDRVDAQLTAHVDKRIAGNTADDVPGDAEDASLAQFAVLLNAFAALLNRFDQAGIDLGPVGIARIMGARSSGVAAMMDEWVAQIDTVLSAALSRILHSAGFKAMEATWRGLSYLVTQTDTSDMLQLHVLDVSMNELHQDLFAAKTFDQSRLFMLLNEPAPSASGYAPYGLVIGDYRIGKDGSDIDFLSRVAEVAAAVHAPFIAQASEALFRLDSFRLLNRPRTLAKLFESVEMVDWLEFREQENARYVALTLPRVLLRLPYGEPDGRNTVPCEGFNFNEDTGAAPNEKDKPDPNAFLWGNPAYFLGQRIAAAFSRYGWTADIFGDEGGVIDGLPTYTYVTPSGDMATLGPIETDIANPREEELRSLGFIGLCHRRGTSEAVFRSSQTTSWPKRYLDNLVSANVNAQTIDSLPCVLVMSRLALYVKAIMRNKIGSLTTRANVEAYLNDWLSNYVLLDESASPQASAAYPLKQAHVVVEDIPEAPGSYRASLFLQPHFQLEQLTASARVVVYL